MSVAGRLVARVASGARVLDLGSGTGELRYWVLVEQPNLEYVIVDRVAGMLALASGSATKLVADAHELPLRTASIDGVMIGEALHHFAHSERALTATSQYVVHRVREGAERGTWCLVGGRKCDVGVDGPAFRWLQAKPKAVVPAG